MAGTSLEQQRVKREKKKEWKRLVDELISKVKSGEKAGKKAGKGMIVTLGGKYNFIDKNRNLISKDVWFDKIVELNEYYILGIAKDRCNIFDTRTGEYIYYGISRLPGWLKKCDREFHDGNLRIQWINGSWDYLNPNGYTILGPRMLVKSATPFSNGKAEITKSDGTKAVIDRRGQVLNGGNIWPTGDEDDDNDDIVDDVVNEVMRRIRKGLI